MSGPIHGQRTCSAIFTLQGPLACWLRSIAWFCKKNLPCFVEVQMTIGLDSIKRTFSACGGNWAKHGYSGWGTGGN